MAAAAQARVTALWAAKRRAAEQAATVPARRRRGLASEVALARRESPTCGNRHLGFAQALVHEMPHTLAALETGILSEWRATLIVKHSPCLSVEHRRVLDAELCADAARLVGWGNGRVEAEAKRIAARLDAAAVVARAAKAAADRSVWIRPAPDTMTYVTFLLPVAQGVAMYATLKREADTTFDGRSRGQVMADTAYQRITGRPAAQPVPVALNMVMADTTLAGDDEQPAWLAGFAGRPAAQPVPVALNMVMADTTLAGDDEQPAWLAGFGPIPAGLTGDAATDTKIKATLRRLYRHPKSGQLVAMESRARIFPKALARFLQLRDQTCRTPYCDAPIRHCDHATPARDGGPTSARNGLGDCEACNYAKEAPGWQVTTTEADGEHRAEYRTPTGAVYQSTAPPLPGPPLRRRISLLEGQLSIDLVTFDAA